MLGWSTPAGPGGLACPPGRAVEGGVLHRSGLGLFPGSRLWVLLGGGASDVPTAFLLASLCSSTIFPAPAHFGPVGRVATWEERPLPRPPGPLEAWAHVFLPRRRRAARGPWVGS